MSGRDNGEANSGHAGQRGSTCVRAGTRLCCSLKGAGVKRAAAGTRAGERKGGGSLKGFSHYGVDVPVQAGRGAAQNLSR